MPLPRSNAEILAICADAIRTEMRNCLPGTVAAVRGQRVDVQLAVNGVLFDELGTRVSVPAPSISDVPVGVMRGGGFLVWVPVAVGDSVMVIFTDLSTDTWRGSPGGGAPVDPGFAGQHTYDSAFAIPCIAPDAKDFVTGDTPGDHVVIGKANADEQIRVGASDIKLGASAVAFVALSNLVLDELTKIQNTLLTGANSGGTVVFSTPYTASTVAATLVKAK